MVPMSVTGSDSDETRKKIILAAAALVLLMILFPPKVIFRKNPIIEQVTTQPAGYNFLFSDPSAGEKDAARMLLGDEVDKYIGSRIEWSRMLLQLFLVGGGAAAGLAFVRRRQPFSSAVVQTEKESTHV